MSNAPTEPAAKGKSSGPRPPNEFLVSAAPHLAAGQTTRKIMFQVVLAMLPMLLAAGVFYRYHAIVLTVVTVTACLATEAVANAIRGRKQDSLSDGSAIVTGMILAFSLPPDLNPYMAFIGGVVAIGLAKAVFGGLGQNLFNPAMVGRAFLMACFPAALSLWTEPGTLAQIGGIDVVTRATPLGAAADPALSVPTLSELFLPLDLFVGNVGGSLGETSALAALVGGLFLVFRRVADWRPVVGVLGSAFVFATIAHRVNPAEFESPWFHLTSGAMMFGAFFIATDYVGAPITPWGRLIFGIGVGVLVMVIRLFGTYPEGFMFAILIMNSLTPLIERWTIPTPFGGHVVMQKK